MVGYYKLITMEGTEEPIGMNEIKSDKDVYNFYYNINRDKKDEFKITSIDDSPVYIDENLKDFYIIKHIIEKNIRLKLNLKEIKTPEVMKYNSKLEELQKLFGLEPFRCNEEYILAPASDFGVFSFFEGKEFKEFEIPLSVYEFARCYRIEDKKKDALKRPTSFYLPDIHCFLNCDIYEEVLKHLKVYEEILHELQIPYFLTLRISEQEYKQRRIELCNIAKHLNKNILVNIVPSSIKYWESKFKYIYKDTNNEFIQLSTVQVDYRTAKIFDIKAKGENVTIIHSAIGSMERLLYAFLDK